ncbi:hypothetical protein DM860_017351 [Cuscuta australis]|uniref:Uncharacterized protein n=1 Tax=Cuscuta australis TaxID=267555 RepID=A0A328DGB5_9ASTE|nr:hypothetical protein DM860_017351 [Cuscuta australis]
MDSGRSGFETAVAHTCDGTTSSDDDCGSYFFVKNIKNTLAYPLSSCEIMQYFFLISGYFTNVTVRDDHFKAKKHKKRMNSSGSSPFESSWVKLVGNIGSISSGDLYRGIHCGKEVTVMICDFENLDKTLAKFSYKRAVARCKAQALKVINDMFSELEIGHWLVPEATMANKPLLKETNVFQLRYIFLYFLVGEKHLCGETHR